MTADAFPQESKSRFGIFSGVSVNMNSYNIDDNSNYLDTLFTSKAKAAFSIGTFFMYDFVKSFSLKLQGLYTIKGGITTYKTFAYSSSVSRTSRNNLSYLELSLLPQYNLYLFKNNYDHRVYFNAGGYLSFMLSAKENFEVNGEDEGSSDISGIIDGNDAGLVFGIGIISRKFMLNVSYDLGLTNIVKETADEDFINIKNRSLNISIGFTGGF